MNIKELKEAIADLPDDTEVVIQKDPEGNGYWRCAGADADALYFETNNRHWNAVEVYSRSWTAEEADMDEGEWEEMKAAQPGCLVLYP